MDWIAQLKLSEVADWIALITFGMTIWIGLQTRYIKTSMMHRIRVPELTNQLAPIQKSIVSELNTWPTSFDSLRADLAKAKGLFSSLLHKTSGDERAQIKMLISRLRGKRSGLLSLNHSLRNSSKEDMWEIVSLWIEVVTRIEQRELDSRWT